MQDSPGFIHLLILTIASVVTSWSLLKILIPILRRKLLDQPNIRSSHTIPTPRGGGLSFVVTGTGLAPLAGSGWQSIIPFICLPLAIIGILDDKRHIHAGFRLGVQIITSIVLVYSSPLDFPVWSVPLVVVASTAVINFFNFMDGIDGLLASCTTLSFLSVAFDSLLHPSRYLSVVGSFSSLWPIIGALIGFLIWNWHPAKIFMGDVGSTFLGAMFAGTVLHQPSLLQAFELMLVAFPLIADSAICVLRRLLAKQPIFQAHRLHLFQRLHQSGWSHQSVALIYSAATFILAFSFLEGDVSIMILVTITILGLGIWLDQNVAVRFSVSLAPAASQEPPSHNHEPN
jgi:UDP-N-acetylmuramyl pentapeptide phosphotransferase/UDP-N-acetylglucosamine-1-phosphate transferase